MEGLKLQLTGCAMLLKSHGLTDQDHATITRLTFMNLLPPPAQWTDHGIAPPSPPIDATAAAAADETVATGGSGKKKNKSKHKWWEDPDDAPWRHEPWVSATQGRHRTIKVKGDGADNWIEFPRQAVEQLLAWYDFARRGDTLQAVVTDIARNHAYDYKIEGGKYLSQRNPSCPDSKPREVQILYAGEIETATNW